MPGFKDLKGIVCTSYPEIISIENPSDFNYIIKLRKPEGMTWRPGEHAVFTIKRRGIRGSRFRPFSIASVQEDNCITLATKIIPNPSRFKEVLRDMQPGDTIHMRGPFGWFVLQDSTSPIVMIAGGIGIVPFPSLMKGVQAQGNTRDVKLIYSSRETHLFRDELDAHAARDPLITVEYIAGREAMAAAATREAQRYGNGAFYYISGAPSMIEAVQAQLVAQGVKKRRILHDPFKGY
eukprot:gnl/Dysnectes_brevis/1413_a1596_1753.p1 GENE.gnl/Dysnectes_brevis/1413_a1596_1753~~gnl/Dysnectes_brevis/1413_a1596_1753.p1  ORF type:complete len:236 (+),score=36.39 gnl/Dysnectes_brevis/1413_a1596_1753:170-877(+)